MMTNKTNYSIEREDGRSKWYRVSFDCGTIERVSSMETSASISIRDGKIASINGNGCARGDFEGAFKLFPYRDFDRGRETEAKEALLDMVCGRGET